MSANAPFSALRRFVGPRERPQGHPCEICASPIGGDHGHLVCIEDRRLLCVCRACHLLFTHEGASQGRYRTTPDRYVYDAAFKLDMAQWDALQVPVGMAFFFFNSTLARACAFYPSPAGATESLLALDAWGELVAANPVLAGLKPDVEALLVRAHLDRTFECFLVPIVDCYALVGEVKLHWKGFDGGQHAHRAIDLFFEELRRKCRSQPTIPEIA